MPAQRKAANTGGRSGAGGSPGVSPADGTDNAAIQAMQAQIERLTQAHDEMAQHIRHLESNYQSVLGEMVNFQRNMAQQDGLMQNLIQYFLQLENGGQLGSSSSSTTVLLSPSAATTAALTNSAAMSANRIGLDGLMLDTVSSSLPLTTSNAAALLSLQAAVAANSVINASNPLVAL